MTEDFEREVNTIEVRYYRNPRPTLDRSLAILAEEALEALQEGLSVGRGQEQDPARLAALKLELIQLSAYAYHLAMRVTRKEV